jgi:hypothetical protein
VIERLTELAADYLERAQALERAPPGFQVPGPPPQDQPMQQQQQVQPKDDGEKD